MARTALSALDPEWFSGLVCEFVSARWNVPEDAIELAPLSLDRETEIRLPDTRLIRFCQYEPPGARERERTP